LLFQIQDEMKSDPHELAPLPLRASEMARTIPSILVVTAGLYAVIGGIVTLLGWAVPIPRFTDWAGRGISMFPNAAVCSISCGIALLLLQFGKGKSGLLKAARAFALVASAVGGATLLEHLFAIDFGIDELLFAGTWGQNASAAPMRMGVPASTSFLILGGGIALASGSGRCRCLASGLAAIPIAIASLSLVGYWFGASQLYGVARYTGIAWQTATILTVLGVGLVASLRECGFMAFLMRPDAGGLAARRLILPIIIIPLLLGWARVLGEDYGMFDDDFGTAIRTLVEIVIFLGFLWWTAGSIAKHATAANEAMEALSASEERFARFMQSLPGLAWIKDPEGRYVYANESAIKVFQKESGALYGLTDAEILPEETAAEFMANDRLALEAPAGLQTIETLRHEDGLLHSSLVSKFPIPGPDGSPALVGGIAIDITDRLRAEERLKEAHRRKDEFIATLAHELRNPLSPIRFSVEICRSQTDSENRDWALDVVDRQVTQMSRLLDDLLDISRISYGKLTLRPELVDLSRIVASAAETSQPLRDEAGQSLHLDLPADRIFLHADPVRLEQIFANLLNNAAKYGGQGSEVRLTATTHDSELVVSIRDNGAGIPANRLSDIFETFSQVRTSTSNSHGGLGIGLSLVKGLVSLHGGRVEARSRGLGHGSEFLVHLPLAPGGALEDEPVAEGAPFADGGEALRLLVADDLADSADSLSAFFRNRNHKVRTAYDGEQALAEARSFRPDVILLDIGMPRLDGHEVCRRIRDEPWGKDVFIIAITGWGQESDRKLTMDAGFDHHLVKPVEINELLSIVTGPSLRSPVTRQA